MADINGIQVLAESTKYHYSSLILFIALCFIIISLMLSICGLFDDNRSNSHSIVYITVAMVTLAIGVGSLVWMIKHPKSTNQEYKIVCEENADTSALFKNYTVIDQEGQILQIVPNEDAKWY